MKQDFAPAALDVRAFARAGAALEGRIPVQALSRLAADLPSEVATEDVRWQAQGELRTPRGGQDQVWLHLQARTVVPLVCQRCLQPLQQPLELDRSFRFVADEATAAAEDDEAEEDLLVLSRTFDLPELLEDELLMEMPLVPRHEACPAGAALPTEAVDADFEGDKPHPFAALQGLRGNKSS